MALALYLFGFLLVAWGEGVCFIGGLALLLKRGSLRDRGRE